jgi:hypothetical protein
MCLVSYWSHFTSFISCWIFHKDSCGYDFHTCAQTSVLFFNVCYLFLLILIVLFILQLVYQLFTTNLTPDEENVKIVMQMAEEAVCAQDRDPYTAFTNRVKELNYGNSYFFRV